MIGFCIILTINNSWSKKNTCRIVFDFVNLRSNFLHSDDSLFYLLSIYLNVYYFFFFFINEEKLSEKIIWRAHARFLKTISNQLDISWIRFYFIDLELFSFQISNQATGFFSLCFTFPNGNAFISFRVKQPAGQVLNICVLWVSCFVHCCGLPAFWKIVPTFVYRTSQGKHLNIFF